MDKIAREYRELTQFIKELEEQADALKQQMIEGMAAMNTDTIITDMFTVRYTTYTSSRVDTKALAAELPDVAARYTKTTEARRFSVA